VFRSMTPLTATFNITLPLAQSAPTMKNINEIPWTRHRGLRGSILLFSLLPLSMLNKLYNNGRNASNSLPFTNDLFLAFVCPFQ